MSRLAEGPDLAGDYGCFNGLLDSSVLDQNLDSTLSGLLPSNKFEALTSVGHGAASGSTEAAAPAELKLTEKATSFLQVSFAPPPIIRHPGAMWFDFRRFFKTKAHLCESRIG
jgi:hypothetical protein